MISDRLKDFQVSDDIHGHPLRVGPPHVHDVPASECTICSDFAALSPQVTAR